MGQNPKAIKADRRRRSGRRRRRRAIMANDWPPRARSAGEECTVGNGWCSFWSYGPARKIGFQADMAHTLLYTLGYNAPEDRILPENWNWSDAGQTRRRSGEH